jgi:hypothetical protein
VIQSRALRSLLYPPSNRSEKYKVAVINKGDSEQRAGIMLWFLRSAGFATKNVLYRHTLYGMLSQTEVPHAIAAPLVPR